MKTDRPVRKSPKCQGPRCKNRVRLALIGDRRPRRFCSQRCNVWAWRAANAEVLAQTRRDHAARMKQERARRRGYLEGPRDLRGEHARIAAEILADLGRPPQESEIETVYAVEHGICL